MATLPVELTAMEVLFLADRTKNDATDDGCPVAKPFLLKIGSAYLEMIGESPKSGTVTIHLTEAETWHARSLFNSGDRCDADSKLGIHILRKLYALLLQFDAAIDLPDAEAGHDLTHKQATKQIDWPPEVTGGKR